MYNGVLLGEGFYIWLDEFYRSYGMGIDLPMSFQQN